jgi:amino acid transporter
MTLLEELQQTPPHVWGIRAGVVVLAAVLYFVPAHVAASRGKRNARAIFVLNFFAGWTLLGWVGALVWAVSLDAPLGRPVAVRPVSSGMFIGAYLGFVFLSLLGIEMAASNSREDFRKLERRHREEIEDLAARIRAGR